jgi:hypothetical protein
MSYQKHNFKNGQVLTAEDLNEVEDGIVAIENETVTSSELSSAVNDALALAKASGEFDGRDGDDYVLTLDDKAEIAEMAAEMVDVPDPGSGGNFALDTDATLKVEDGVLSVNTTNKMEQNNMLPITSAGVFTVVGNIEALLKTV